MPAVKSTKLKPWLSSCWTAVGKTRLSLPWKTPGAMRLITPVPVMLVMRNWPPHWGVVSSTPVPEKPPAAPSTVKSNKSA